jgi:hypothetical protein
MILNTGQTFASSLGSFVSGISTVEHVIQWDSAGTFLTGVMKQQATGAFSLASISGNYAFGAAGVDNSGKRFGIAGAFTADGAGNVNNGQADINDNGSVNGGSGLGSPFNFSGTYTDGSLASNGRATTTITYPAIPLTVHQALYVVSAGEFFDIGIDALSSTTSLYSGSMAQQSGRPYSNASTNGTYVFYRAGQSASGSDTKLGFFSPDGSGNYALSRDHLNGSVYDFNSANGTYSNAANGRITFLTGATTQVTYIADDSVGGGFNLDSASTVGLGRLQTQTGGPFSDATLSGNYSFGNVDPTNAGHQLQSGIATADGSGHLGITEYDSGARPNSAVQTPALGNGIDYIVPSNGRIFGPGITMYVISPSRALVLDKVLIQVDQ